jgi:crotonobetainyl-CoA hydratase
MTDHTSSAVLAARAGHIMTVTINRPEARNAVNAAVWSGIGRALAAAECNPEIRVVILTGAGTESFSAGADLKVLARGGSIEPTDPEELAWGFAGLATHPVSKPLIAAVNGTALGGGLEIALGCDLIIAAETARFGLPEVTRGFVAGAGGAFRIVEQLPQKLAMELLLTGQPIPAARALELGLVNRVVPQTEVMEAATALAGTIARNAPLAVQASKRIALGIAGGVFQREREAWAINDRETAEVLQSDDAIEGPRAFAEKRAPVWRVR